MSENKWQVGPVKLVNNEDAFIDAINEGQDAYRYTGRMMGQNGFVPVGWHADGRLPWPTTDHPKNLAPPPKKKVRIQTLLVVYGNGKTCNFSYFDRARAVIEANKRGFALIEINREVEEGEGL